VAVATKSQNKTGFVNKFLSANPQGNAMAVNEAWAAAKMKGTIGSTLINKIRSEMGLSGNLRAKSKPKTAKAESGNKMSKPATSPGKSMFVKEFLNDHPQGNLKAVNEAWQVGGFDGTISGTLIKKIRSSLGLTGNLRRKNTKKSKTSTVGKQRVAPRKQTVAAVNGGSIRTVVLNELETDVDLLIFRAMAIGGLNEFEDSLRQARRLLYGALTRG
jgi:hypothetical protein